MKVISLAPKVVRWSGQVTPPSIASIPHLVLLLSKPPYLESKNKALHMMHTCATRIVFLCDIIMENKALLTYGWLWYIWFGFFSVVLMCTLPSVRKMETLRRPWGGSCVS